MNINNNEEEFRLLTFNTYDRKIEDEDNNDNSNENNNNDMNNNKKKNKSSKEFIVQMFGINEKGKTASIFVEDYLPFFYAKVNNEWKEQEKLEFILKKLRLRFMGKIDYNESCLHEEIMKVVWHPKNIHKFDDLKIWD